MSNVTEITPAARRSHRAKKDAGVPLKDIIDWQSGSLAEAEALADAIDIFATDSAQLRDNSFEMLSKRRCPMTDEIMTDISEAQRDLIDLAISKQAIKLYAAEAIVESVAEALMTRFSTDWPADLPNYPLALRHATRMMRQAYGRLEMLTLIQDAKNIEAEIETEVGP